MKNFYGKLAVTNLKNNRQFYLPYLLAGMVSGIMFYIMCAIRANDGIDAMRGSSALKMVLSMGIFIVGVCAGVFLFYTNGFVMKRRKKELGIYNILGMEKKHIAKVMAWESVILYVITVIGGLVFGILFHKLAAMFLYKLTGLTESIPFMISGKGCLSTVILFGILYILMIVYNFIQVKLANPIALLHGNQAGEREPKAKWISAVIGMLCILGGYYLAAAVYGVLEAVNMFFIAVLLVIVGTYELFMTVSIAVLKLLKSNKKFYYKTTHFISVSGMLYRMKRNAAGLANICILSTMVLVIVSTTVCMYAGTEESLQTNFEREVSVTFYFDRMPETEIKNSLMRQFMDVAQEQNRTVTQEQEYVDMTFVTHAVGKQIDLYEHGTGSYNFQDMSMLYIMTTEDYEKRTGISVGGIGPQTAAFASLNDYSEDSVTVFGKEYQITSRLDFPEVEMESFLGNMDAFFLIVTDESEMKALHQRAEEISGEPKDVNFKIAMEIDGTLEEKRAYISVIREIMQANSEPMGFQVGMASSRAEQRDEYMQMNGGFLFLGLFLGSMFLMITVLIIYYKQISEGLEDRERFAIMTKVGMGLDTIRSTINSQMRTVFFLPITVAVIHLIAAFPMLKLILLIFGLGNTMLFAVCMVVTAAIFAIIYFIVFQITSRSYIKIVYC